FLFASSHYHRYLHSFLTRRSSDLPCVHHSRSKSELKNLQLFEHHRLIVQVENDDVKTKAQRPSHPFNRQSRVRGRRADRFGRRSDRKSTRLNSSHSQISYAVFCLK